MSIGNVLSNLGYKTIDSNKEWRCQALYRNGDSPISLSVNKETGNFYDFVTHQGGSLKELIELTTKEEIEDFEIYLEGFEINITDLEEKPRIMSEKTWEEKELDNLFPHYKFYEKKGIQKTTLRTLKSGMAQSGQMNKRYIFPIINKDGKIHGWTGRTMLKSSQIKWKHIGKTRTWIYPYFIKEGGKSPCEEAIRAAGSVILVESIGDMLALWENGHKNVLVTFGVKISKDLAAHIMSLNVKVIISTNNDLSKVKNWGANASIDIFVALLKYIDYKRIVIALPCGTEDFGEEGHDFEKWKKKIENPNCEAIHKAVLKRMRELLKEKKLSKTSIKMAQAISSDYDAELT